MHESTPALTRRIAAGDPAAVAALYEAWFDRLYAEARRRTRRDEAFCLDLVQDVFVDRVPRIPVLRDDAALGAWLYRCLHRAALDRLRAETRRRTREGAPRPEPRPSASAEDLAWLRAELERLDPNRRRLLDLRHGLGWTLTRIGAIVGLTPGAVDGRLHRIEAGLRERAEEAGHDP